MWRSAVGCIVPLILSLLMAPLAVDAQPAKTVPRVGYLSPGSSSDPARLRRFEAFRQGLRELGYKRIVKKEPALLPLLPPNSIRQELGGQFTAPVGTSIDDPVPGIPSDWSAPS